MSERLGSSLPIHLDGRCGFDPTRTDRICGAPAVLHAWIGAQTAPDACTVAACEEHASFVLEALQPLDWHQYTPECNHTRERTWIFSGTPGDSFCISPEDEHDHRELVASLTASGGEL